MALLQFYFNRFAVPAFSSSATPRSRANSLPGAKALKLPARRPLAQRYASCWKCRQTRTPYSELKYLANLRKKGSPLPANGPLGVLA